MLSRSEILDRVWDWAYDGTSNVIDVYVRNLRTKMAGHPWRRRIETVRGMGYVLRPAEHGLQPAIDGALVRATEVGEAG